MAGYCFAQLATLKDNSQSWLCYSMNPAADGKYYQFAGETLQDQLDSVNYLSSCMRCGQQEVTEKLSKLLDLGGDSVSDAVNALFKETNTMQFGEEIIYNLPDEEECLWEFIEEVGEALELALDGVL